LKDNKTVWRNWLKSLNKGDMKMKNKYLKSKQGKIQISFTSEQRKMLKVHSEDTGNSISTIVRMAIIDYFKNLEDG